MASAIAMRLGMMRRQGHIDAMMLHMLFGRILYAVMLAELRQLAAMCCHMLTLVMLPLALLQLLRCQHSGNQDCGNYEQL